MSAYVPLTVNFYGDHCIGEAMTVAAPTQTISLQLGSGTSNFLSLEIKTETEEHITGSGNTDSATECDALYFYGYTDAALTTAIDANSSPVGLTAADTITAGAVSPAV